MTTFSVLVNSLLGRHHIGTYYKELANALKAYFHNPADCVVRQKNRTDPISAVTQQIHAARHRFILYGTDSFNM
jgi:hypothetical protein